jgi:protocatechuate 3,4-dioxygenase beta subunit
MKVQKAIVCIFLILGAANCVCSQSPPTKTGTATITGKVTIKGKGVPGFVIVANDNSRGWNRTRYRATSDETGAYRINVLPGTYHVMPLTLAFVLEDQTMNTSVMINENETVENLNFSLVRGGVITGKVTDSDGKALIEEAVMLMPVEGVPGNMVYLRMVHQTDDRGIYRAFGLVPGKYKVSVGQSRGNLMGGPKREFRQTFYPSVTDIEKATLVEVKEGGEANDINIVVGRPLTTFTIRGLIVDEAGKPVPNATYGVMRSMSDGGRESTSGSSSNARGEFKIDNVLPGKYSLFVANEGLMPSLRGDVVSFEVVDHDVNDIVIKTSKGAIVSGVVAFEGGEEKPGVNKFTNLYINAWGEKRESDLFNNTSTSVRPDGSFQVNGLAAGTVRFNISQMGRAEARSVSIVRVERDGIVQPRGISIKDGEVVTGLRLVVKYLTGGIRGQVKFEGSDSVPASRISVWLNMVDDGSSASQRMGPHNSPSQVDSRGRFLVEGLAAGTYEVNVGLFDAGRYDTTQIYKQQVIVTDNTVSEVVITVKQKP